MPRPKGSKNKKATELDLEVINAKISSLSEEISELSSSLAAKKKQLTSLKRDRTKAEQFAEVKKENEERNKLMHAIEASGKSVDEVLAMLNKD